MPEQQALDEHSGKHEGSDRSGDMRRLLPVSEIFLKSSYGVVHEDAWLGFKARVCLRVALRCSRFGV